MSPTKPNFALVAVLLVAIGLPRSGEAYRRTQTCDPGGGAHACNPDEAPKPISWPMRCVRYRINDDGTSDIGTGTGLTDDLRQLVNEAFEAWNEPSCSDFQMVEGKPTSNETVQYNEDAGWKGNMNLVVWRDQNWPYGEGDGVSKYAFALTSVSYGSEEGTITDADLEVNTAVWNFADLEESRVEEDDPPVDLLNTMTHEVGHFLGLAHPENRPEATMHGQAPDGEIKKRSLEEDDIDGLCAIYPRQQDPATCDSPRAFRPPRARDDRNGRNERGICSISGATSDRLPVVVTWLGFVLINLSLRRRSEGDGSA